MSTVERAEPKLLQFSDLTATAVRFMHLCGIDVHTGGTVQQQQQQRRTQYMLIVQLVNLNCILVGEFMFAASNWSNQTHLDEFILGVGFTVYGLLGMVKTSLNYMNRHKIRELLSSLHALFPVGAKEQLAYDVQQYVTSYNWRYKPYVHTIMTLAHIQNISPMLVFLVRTYWLQHDNVERALPFFIWLPWEMTWSYYPIYLMDMCAGYTAVASQIAGDSLLYGTVSQINMHYNYLARTMRNYIATGDINDLRFWHEAIAYHQKILHLSDLVNDIFHICLLFNFMTSSLLICCLGFQLTMQIDTESFAFALVFLASSLFQVYIMSLYGDDLVTSSTDVGAAIFEHDWHNADIRYKKMLSISMQRAQKAAMLKTTFFTITMQTFTELMQLSYKFLALLRTMYAE